MEDTVHCGREGIVTMMALWGEEYEVTGHIASIIGKQREMNVGAQLNCSTPFSFSMDPDPRGCCPHSG